MIIAITNFQLPKPLTREQARSIFLTTAPTYRGVKGLVRKSYFVADDGNSVGGIYLWNSRAEAEAAFTESWRGYVREKYHSEPSVAYFESPVTVDNGTNEIPEAGTVRGGASGAGVAARSINTLAPRRDERQRLMPDTLALAFGLRLDDCARQTIAGTQHGKPQRTYELDKVKSIDRPGWRTDTRYWVFAKRQQFDASNIEGIKPALLLHLWRHLPG